MAEVRATTKLDSRGFKAGTQQMKGSIQKLSASLGAFKGVLAGAFSIGAITNLARKTIDFGSTITDLALQAGLTTDQFQALEIAALDAGVQQDKIRTAMSKLNVVMGQAKRGMKTYVDMFEQVGITQQELESMDPAAVFERLAQTIATAERGSVEFGAALEILGTRSGAQLIEVFQRVNNEGLQGMIDKGKAAGKIMGEDLVNNLDEAADAMARFERASKVGMANTINFFDKAGRQIGRNLTNVSKGEKGGLLGMFTKSIGIGALGGPLAQMAYLGKKYMTGSKGGKTLAQSEIAKRIQDQEKAEKNAAKNVAKVTEPIKKEAIKKEAKIKEAAEINTAEKVASLKKRLAGVEVAGTSASVDRLASIGGSIGGSVSPQLRIARQAMELDKRRNDLIKSQTDQTIKAFQEGGGLA